MKVITLKDSDAEYTLNVNVTVNKENNLTDYIITNTSTFNSGKKFNDSYSVHTIIPVTGLDDEIVSLQEFFNELYKDSKVGVLVDLETLLMAPFTRRIPTKIFECYDKKYLANSGISPLGKLFGIIIYNDSEIIPTHAYQKLNDFAKDYKNILKSLLTHESAYDFHFEAAANIYLNYFFKINGWGLTPDAIETLEVIKSSYLDMDIYNGESMELEGFIINILSFVLMQTDDTIIFNENSFRIIEGDLLVTRQEQLDGYLTMGINNLNSANGKTSLEFYREFLSHCNNLFNLKVMNKEVREAIGELTLSEIVKFTKCLVEELNSPIEVKNYVSEYASKDSTLHNNNFNVYVTISAKFLKCMSSNDHITLHKILFENNIDSNMAIFFEKLVNDERFFTTRENYLKLIQLFFSNVSEKWCSNSYQRGLILNDLTEIIGAYEVFKIIDAACDKDSPLNGYNINYTFWSNYIKNYRIGGYESMPIDWTFELHLK